MIDTNKTAWFAFILSIASLSFAIYVAFIKVDTTEYDKRCLIKYSGVEEIYVGPCKELE